MPVFEARTQFPVSAEELFRWHARPGAFERLMPPWENMRVLERVGGITEGSRLTVEVRKGPLRFRCEALHGEYVEGRLFRDELLRGPFARWVHTHRFHEAGPNGSVLEDHIEYALPFGVVGALAGGRFADAQLHRMFRFRHCRTLHDLARHHRFASAGPQRIAVTGGTGLVGRNLIPFLTTGGHEVRRLVRGGRPPEAGEIPWDPAASRLDPECLEGLDAVVHLSGSSVSNRRWSPAVKEEILASRVGSTRLLSETLTRLKRPPRVLICASGSSLYADTSEPATEQSPETEGFLTQVTREWEAAADPARAAGIRVVHLRIGAVVSAQGGILARLLPIFQAGLGGPIGTGCQGLSWIALDDLLGVVQHALFTEQLSGPVNTVAPEPLTNAEFMRTLARAVRRPVVLPLPAAAVRLGFGEMGEEVLLRGARVVPAKLLQSGFPFLHPGLEGAIRTELGTA